MLQHHQQRSERDKSRSAEVQAHAKPPPRMHKQHVGAVVGVHEVQEMTQKLLLDAIGAD